MRDLLRHQVSESLDQWRAAHLLPAPPGGWARAVREALGMSARALAERMQLTRAGVQKLESSEANGTISLASLHRLADALDCDLRYALVPRKSLEELLLDRAREVAADELSPVAHSMALEDQRVADAGRRQQIEMRARQLVARGTHRTLW